MVQFIQRPRTTGERLSEGLGNALGPLNDQQQQMKMLEQQNQAAMQKELMKQEMKQNFLSKLFGGDQQQEEGSGFQDQLMQEGAKKKQGFNPSEVTDEQLAMAYSTDKSLGDALKFARESSEKKQQFGRKEEIGFHKESAKYDEDLSNKTRIAKNQIHSINDIKKAISSGNVKPGSLANIFRGMGTIGDKIANAFLTKDEATLLANIPQLLEGWKDVFGVRLSDADLRVLQDKLPDLGKDPATNKSILNIMEKYAEMTLLRGKIASDIKKQNKGIRPLGYADMIEERFDEMVKPVKVISPSGKLIEIPANKVSQALEAGGKLANE